MLNDKKRMLERGEIFLNSGKKKEQIKKKVKISFEMAAQIPNNSGSDNIFLNHTLSKSGFSVHSQNQQISQNGYKIGIQTFSLSLICICINSLWKV